ncbi:enolase C-terminal domain-like protein [Streptomyces sp. TX20-6-3]|uniref:enolase C-terminal domain-like protein n=1 Tax=Streptomyces sp. TX20-6-3 TaxID=3028705 RepID=UPI0029BCBB4A|nr:enolase C-terminal domain-like protein [Streptomyces sp. TX20-6-3]MDX2563560.1 enolase C-terminal domain-like protein [Streptomyces sp. TX20-6-3]
MDAKLIVDEVRLTPILISDPPLLNVQGVHQPYTPRLVVEVITRGGVSGLGETYGDGVYLDLARPLAEALPGRSVTDVNALFALAEATDPGRRSGAGSDPGSGTEAAGAAGAARAAGAEAAEAGAAEEAGVDAGGLRGVRTAEKLRLSVVSAFETACLDALGKTLGLPVHALLGGKVRDSVEFSAYLFHRWATHPAGGPVDDWGAALDPAGIVAQARRFDRAYGFRSFKLKGGVFAPEQEIAAIRALAEEFPGRPLRLDPNGAWSVETSLSVARELKGVLEYLEDPASGTGAMAEIAAGTEVPLATNMCVTTFEEVPEAFAKGAVQIVLCDHHYWGGLGRTRELAALCRTYGVGLSMHSNTHLGISLAAMTQVAATLPELHHACDTHYPWQTEDVVTTRPVFREGRLTVSDAPGLGVELDREALATLHRRWREDDGRYRNRDDAAAMRAANPNWTPHTW